MLLSQYAEQDTIRVPSGEKEREEMLCRCPSNDLDRAVPVWESQMRTVQSAEPVARRLSSRENATAVSEEGCPFHVGTDAIPVSAFDSQRFPPRVPQARETPS